MRRYYITSILFFALVFIIGCAALQTGKSIPRQHEKLETAAPVCSECHDKGSLSGGKSYASYNHDQSFYNMHGAQAGSFQAICESCHKQKFCSDCHGNEEEIAPSKKLGNRPDLTSPHRGDYFTKHKIEGRLDQAECFKCHGRRNNKSCDKCH